MELQHDEVVKDIADRISALEGTRTYLSDLPYLITATENANGSWYSNAAQAREDLEDNPEVLGAAIDYVQQELATNVNAVSDPENAHVVAMIELYRGLCVFGIQDHEDYNNSVEITDEHVKFFEEHVPSDFNVF